jgi:hypothetical protein
MRPYESAGGDGLMRNVYIILSQTGTLFSRLIALYTRDQYNHASFAFESNLPVMYSFGRRRRYNMLDCGFVQESFTRGLFSFFPNARCCVLEIPVTQAEYDVMQDAVNSFCQNYKQYRYNLLGVFSYIFGIGLVREDYYFCSQFVSYILNYTSFWKLSPQFTRPIDFLSIPHRHIIFEGRVSEFIALHSANPVPGEITPVL